MLVYKICLNYQLLWFVLYISYNKIGKQEYQMVCALFGKTLLSTHSTKVNNIVSLCQPLIGLPLHYAWQLQKYTLYLF